MTYKTLVKTVSGHFEHRKVGLGLLAGFLLSLTYLSPSIYYSLPLPNVNLNSTSTNGAPTTSPAIINDYMKSSLNLEVQNRNVTDDERKPRCDESTRRRELCDELGGSVKTNGSSTSEASDDHSFEQSVVKSTNTQLRIEKNIEGNQTASKTDLAQIKVPGSSDQSENNTIQLEGINSIIDEASQTYNETTAPQNSTATIITTDSSAVTSNSNQSGVNVDDVKPEDTKITCDTSRYRRSDRCEMEGDVRIHGKSGSVVFVSSSANETWRIKPYARKADAAAMASVRELSVRPSSGDAPPRCTVNHSVPAVVFSVTGYTGNFFHDMSDVFVPLFQTSYHFRGEVQFLVTNHRRWWTDKYSPIFNQLSNYQLVDLDSDDAVRCFPRAAVGLDSDGDLLIDASRSKNGCSMADFGRMLRKAYSLPRESPVRLAAKHPRRKPRLLVVARGRTRRFTNIGEIAAAAGRAGFEVEVAEAGHDVSRFAGLANSCDAMVGVHGAGLTNFVFLPPGAVLIQVVPWGNLDWIATNYFERPPRAMKLRYLEYRIAPEESTLSETYSRDDPVFADPSSLHRRGWDAMREVFLVKQSVRLDVRRFRPVLVKAMKMLRSKKNN
ncbi:uncharacterized protein M6B38_236290 [Iris pallida]|uniref:Glycosyltransferase 61 catalytic domain-containing protein n=1 Tax=Iris pallida TaxID=29817 RepID=A0AAX6DP47_IRIPA|nr:uncharacterized protein M6B38_236290 [Iris pallida]